MKRADKTLVILIPGFPENEADTTCLPMQQNFVRVLHELYPGFGIIILGFQYPYCRKKYEWFGIPVISFNGKNKGGLARLLLRRKITRTLEGIYRSGTGVELLSFWYGECAWIGEKFSARHHLPHYCWIMGQDAKKENKYPGRLQMDSSRLIALSDFLQGEFEKNHGTMPLTVVPPGINSNSVAFNNDARETDILAAGSLIPLKQYGVFINIIAGIKEQVTGLKVILVGDGPEKARLQTLIKTLGLEQTITLTGILPHPELLKMMGRSRLFLHPSSYEGFSGVCLEALGVGCHVISFCRPMKEEIENWQIASSADDMRNKAVALLNQEDLTFKEGAVCKMEDTVGRIMKLYNANR